MQERPEGDSWNHTEDELSSLSDMFLREESKRCADVTRIGNNHRRVLPCATDDVSWSLSCINLDSDCLWVVMMRGWLRYMTSRMGGWRVP